MYQVEFQFDNQEQMKIFVDWFKQRGYSNLLLSDVNVGKQDQLSCMSTDEEMEWGHYFELQ